MRHEDTDDVTADEAPVDAGSDGVPEPSPPEFLGELDESPSSQVDVTAEAAVVESLNSALKQLRTDADGLESMPLDGTRVDAAEQLAEDAARLDEHIGTIARADET